MVMLMQAMEKAADVLSKGRLQLSTPVFANGREYTDKRWNFSPRAMLFYDFTENANVRLFYFGRSAQPSVPLMQCGTGRYFPSCVSM